MMIWVLFLFFQGGGGMNEAWKTENSVMSTVSVMYWG